MQRMMFLRRHKVVKNDCRRLSWIFLICILCHVTSIVMLFWFAMQIAKCQWNQTIGWNCGLRCFICSTSYASLTTANQIPTCAWSPVDAVAFSPSYGRIGLSVCVTVWDIQWSSTVRTLHLLRYAVTYLFFQLFCYNRHKQWVHDGMPG